MGVNGMKAIGIVGSPRKNGNVDTLVQANMLNNILSHTVL